MRRPHRLLASLLATTFVIAACGSDGNDSETATDGDRTPSDAPGDSPDEAPADGPVTIDIVDFTYLPDTITVAAGTEVTFVNGDGQAHTATADDGEFNTKSIDGNDEATVTVEGSGEVTYFCSFHPFMKASITVS